MTTVHPTADDVITPFDAAADFGIIADGFTDVTGEIQTALVMIGNLGGGAVFLPAGHYKVAGNLNIPSGVTLRGDWRKPGPGEPVTGTVLMAYAGRGDENAKPYITLNNSAGVNGLSIWYPEPTPADIRPYPPSIGNGGGGHHRERQLRQFLLGFHQLSARHHRPPVSAQPLRHTAQARHRVRLPGRHRAD